MREKSIQGAGNIEKEILSMLNYEKKKLLKEIAGMENEYLYVSFNEMNNIFGRLAISKIEGGIVYPDMDVLSMINGCKGVIDTILEAKHTIIKHPQSGEEYKKIRLKLREYFNIANLYSKLEIQKKWPSEKAIIKKIKI